MRTFVYIIISFWFISCHSEPQELHGYHIEIYDNTPALKLIKAIKRQDTNKIKKLATSKVINYQESHFGITPLYWALLNSKYDAAKVLIECGADPNIKCIDGETALMQAANIPGSSELLKLLLKHGAQVNVIANDSLTINVTPLISAAGVRMESVLLLLAAGVDTNYISQQGDNALQSALIFRRMDIAKYLMIDCNSRFKTPPELCSSILRSLRGMTFPLNSEKYKQKMEIVDYMKKNGVDYWKEPIPDFIQEKYPKEYLDKY